MSINNLVFLDSVNKLILSCNTFLIWENTCTKNNKVTKVNHINKQNFLVIINRHLTRERCLINFLIYFFASDGKVIL